MSLGVELSGHAVNSPKLSGRSPVPRRDGLAWKMMQKLIAAMLLASAECFQMPSAPKLQQHLSKLAASSAALAVTFHSEAAHAKSVLGVNGGLDFGPLAGDQPGGEGTGKVRSQHKITHLHRAPSRVGGARARSLLRARRHTRSSGSCDHLPPALCSARARVALRLALRARNDGTIYLHGCCGRGSGQHLLRATGTRKSRLSHHQPLRSSPPSSHIAPRRPSASTTTRSASCSSLLSSRLASPSASGSRTRTTTTISSTRTIRAVATASSPTATAFKWIFGQRLGHGC
jgi:hypothetical protein